VSLLQEMPKRPPDAAEGATVFLRYSGVSFYSGPVEVDGEAVLTNELGKFYIPPKSQTLMGGIGGFSVSRLVVLCFCISGQYVYRFQCIA
jgi:hypothetical protein